MCYVKYWFEVITWEEREWYMTLEQLAGNQLPNSAAQNAVIYQSESSFPKSLVK